jgi:hypothetical protein
VLGNFRLNHMLAESNGNLGGELVPMLTTVATGTDSARRLAVFSRIYILTRRRMRWILIWTLSASVIFSIVEVFNLFRTYPHHRSIYQDGLGESCARDTNSNNLTGWRADWETDSLCGLSLSQEERKIVSFDGQNNIAFRLPPPLLATRLPFTLKPTTSLPAYCIDSHLSRGTPCPCTIRDLDNPTKLDVIWSWVNGSDPLHIRSLQATQKLLSYTSVPKLFRCVGAVHVMTWLQFEVLCI